VDIWELPNGSKPYLIRPTKDTIIFMKDKLSKEVNNYETTLSQLQNLVQQIESNETSFSELLEKVQTANNLVDTCKKSLKNVTEIMDNSQ
jgi:exodeoxyribonuclease VII small subunit